MSTTEREKLEKLYGVFSEAATTKGRWAHIEPETCGEVADVLGRQIEGDSADKEPAEWRPLFITTGRRSGKSEFLRLYRAWVENDETGR